jgi:hypothetical protein
MSEFPPDREPQPAVDPLYVESRRVLLDALTALQPHGVSVILAGAQAIYLRTGEADVAVAPYTTDGDLALDPAKLADSPTLEAAMRGAHFHLDAEPGIWLARAQVAGEDMLIPVDLIVPDGVATGGGRRDARLQGQGTRVARRARGLEAALIDHGPMVVSALDSRDQRSVRVEVAGPAALLVAKLHKLHDRVASERATRIDDKDAADVVRIMQTTEPAAVADTLAALCRDPVAGEPTATALAHLDALFGRRGRRGIAMASRALRTGMPEARVEALCIGYASAVRSRAEGLGPRSIPPC